MRPQCKDATQQGRTVGVCRRQRKSGRCRKERSMQKTLVKLQKVLMESYGGDEATDGFIAAGK